MIKPYVLGCVAARRGTRGKPPPSRKTPRPADTQKTSPGTTGDPSTIGAPPCARPQPRPISRHAAAVREARAFNPLHDSSQDARRLPRGRNTRVPRPRFLRDHLVPRNAARYLPRSQRGPHHARGRPLSVQVPPTQGRLRRVRGPQGQARDHRAALLRPHQRRACAIPSRETRTTAILRHALGILRLPPPRRRDHTALRRGRRRTSPSGE